MTVGQQLNKASVDQLLTNYATRMRNLMQDVSNLSLTVNGTGQGLAVLEELGYSPDASASNPGGMSDAAYALQLIAYLNTPAGVYAGAVQAGGSGGAGAVAFSYNTALSVLWSGQ